MTQPLVSVLIVYYKNTAQLHKAIESVLEQTHTEVEIIVINDGSPATANLNRQLAPYTDDKRVQVIHQETRGRAAGLNTALARARGKYINFLEADDWLYPDKIARQVEILESSPATGLVYCETEPGATTQEVNGAIQPGLNPAEEEGAQKDFFEALWLAGFPGPGACLFRRQWYEQAGELDTTFSITPEYEYWLRLSVLGCEAYHQPEILATIPARPTTPEILLELKTARELIARQYSEKVATASANLAEAQNRLQTRLGELEQDKLSQSQYVLSLEQHSRQQRQEIKTLSQHLRRLNRELQALDSHAGALDSDRHLLHDYVSKLEQDRQSLISNLSALENQLQSLLQTRSVRAFRTLGTIGQQLQSFKPSSVLQANPVTRRLRGAIDGSLDLPAPGSLIDYTLQISGWAISQVAPVEQVQVWLAGNLLGQAEYGLARPDVAARRPGHPDAGYSASFNLVPQSVGLGEQELVIVVTDTKGNRLELTRRLQLVQPVTQPQSQPEEAFSYEDWIRHNEPDAALLDQQRQYAATMAYQPLFTIITPVYNPPVEILEDTINSVLAQTYPHWELCLVDGSSSDAQIRFLLNEMAENDPRIRVRFLPQNLGIVGNSNLALEMAQGQFCALLDHDDVLAPNALYEAAQALNFDRKLDFIYSDHDLLSKDGNCRFQPLFKPDWSPEIMLSANYLTHLTIIRTSVMRQAGAFQEGTEGAQDWDLFWRVLEKTPHIKHLPRVLYHWRASEVSTATDIYRKPEAPLNQIKAIQAHLQRQGLAQAEAFFDSSGFIRVRWPLKGQPKISIIIPTKNRLDLLRPCVQSILERTEYDNFELLIVDTGSTDPEVTAYYESLSSHPKVRLLRYRLPFNYSAVNNWAAEYASGELLVFLNNDTEVISPQWLEELAQWGQRPEIGIVGAKLIKPDGTIQHAGVVVGLSGFANNVFGGTPEAVDSPYGLAEWYRNYSAVTAACMLVRREVFNELGGFEEKFKLNGSDVDFCLRAGTAGYRIVYNPFAKLYHVESATHQGKNLPPEDFELSQQSYMPLLQTGDPYYNPNLSYWSTIPRLSRPEEPLPLDFVRDYVNRLYETNQLTRTNTVTKDNRSDLYSQEAALISNWLDFNNKDVEQSQQVMRLHSGRIDIRSINWFIPLFQHAFYGGIHTILRFAAYYYDNYGVQSNFVILGHTSERIVHKAIIQAFPQLRSASITVISTYEDLLTVEPSDVAIATFWSTAYYLLRFNQTRRKFYFIQDYEPLFYPAGSTSAQVEASYRFGFYGITNTISLKNIYEHYYGGRAAAFTPAVNTQIFYPPTRPAIDPATVTVPEPYTVFFYGRPGHSRNGFELGIAALRKVKAYLGDRVRIVTAGATWKPEDYSLGGVIENLGLLKYEETAELYRNCDVGLVMMFTRHPSYLPFELMACGCLVVTNENPSTSWFLKDGENCLLSQVSASSLADNIQRGLLDQPLRQRITRQAAELIQTEYADWPAQMEGIYEFMTDPSSQSSGPVRKPDLDSARYSSAAPNRKSNPMSSKR